VAVGRKLGRAAVCTLGNLLAEYRFEEAVMYSEYDAAASF